VAIVVSLACGVNPLLRPVTIATMMAVCRSEYGEPRRKDARFAGQPADRLVQAQGG
jgi:hypothetical protein